MPRDGKSPLTAYSLDALISMRDRFLSECFDIESGRRYVIDADDAESRLSVLRQRIDEIHEEMAQRDMGQAPGPKPLEPLRPSAPLLFVETQAHRPVDREVRPSTWSSAPSQAVSSADFSSDKPGGIEPGTADLAARMEARIRLLDRMAEQAELQGAFSDAVACIRAAQDLDREREAFRD
ncbi:MAG: hypothetical protein ACFB6R_14020 [Alphaproteobacteria bacterium]